MASSVQTLQTLADLLNPPKEEGRESEEELDAGPSPYATPGAIGPTKPPSATDRGGREEGGSKKGKQEIWEEDEVSVRQQYEYDDPRPQPEYEVLYKQAVTAEDVFLGMGAKNPTTASCEDLVVQVKLPGTEFKDVELDVTESYLDCRTPKFRLGLHLPHPVDQEKRHARWHTKDSTLEVTLRMNRQFDYINHD